MLLACVVGVQNFCDQGGADTPARSPRRVPRRAPRASRGVRVPHVQMRYPLRDLACWLSVGWSGKRATRRSRRAARRAATQLQVHSLHASAWRSSLLPQGINEPIAIGDWFDLDLMCQPYICTNLLLNLQIGWVRRAQQTRDPVRFCLELRRATAAPRVSSMTRRCNFGL